MKIFKRIGIVFLVISMTALMSGFQSFGPKSEVLDEKYAEGVVIVQFEKSLPESAKVENIKALNAIRAKNFDTEGLELIKLQKSQKVPDAIEKLKKMKGVVFAEPDYILRPTYIPNDTYFYLMWGLNNSNDIDIDAPEAWDIEQGKNTVTVAVIDTGIQINHPDLYGQFVTGYDFYYDDNTVYDGPSDDHGTHVAGTIAALDNSIGVIGVAPNVKIMPLKFLGPDGGYTSDAIDAINYAKNNNADIINASWGGGGYSDALKNAIESFGRPFIAASGNSGINTDKKPHYPSSYSSSNIVSVAAIDKLGALASFSNYGLNTVDIAAPGVDIASTYPDSYAYMSGTSMATPHVTGIMALLKSRNANLSTQDLIDALYSTAVSNSNLAGKIKTGGVANAHKALLAISEPVVDTTAPVLDSTIPQNGLDSVKVNTEVSMIFDEAVKWNGTTMATIDGVSKSLNVTDKKVSLSDVGMLSYDKSYEVVLPANAISDINNNFYSQEIRFSFRTETEPIVQVDPLKILRTKPSEGQSGVKIGADIYFYVDKTITNIDTNLIEIKDSSGNTSTFSVKGINNTTLTVNPDSNLLKQTTYTVTLKAGALKSGDSMNSDFTLNFTTVSR
ncbi:MAG: S8 family serine peptidase [Proteocatella sp.]